MKILYINDYNPDYMTSLLFHGLVSLEHEVIDLNYMNYLDKCNEYKITRNNLYGLGFSYAFTINKDRSLDDRSNIEEKISEHYFDIIILSTRNIQYINLIIEKYKLGEIFVINGDDISPYDSWLFEHNNVLYFKREILSPSGLNNTYTHVYPISFSIPKEKFQNKNYYKPILRNIDDYKPHCIYLNSGTKIYNITNEQDYYDKYNNTAFVLTGKKGGHDALRHYEIIASHSLPVYIDWDLVPKTCMVSWPNLLQLKANTLYIDYISYNLYDDDQFANRYFKLLDEFYDYAYNNLTTEKIAEYLLSFC